GNLHGDHAGIPVARALHLYEVGNRKRADAEALVHRGTESHEVGRDAAAEFSGHRGHDAADRREIEAAAGVVLEQIVRVVERVIREQIGAGRAASARAAATGAATASATAA